jgi:phosphoketolase
MERESWWRSLKMPDFRDYGIEVSKTGQQQLNKNTKPWDSFAGTAKTEHDELFECLVPMNDF